MVGRAVKCALESKVLDRVLVSTDDEDIRREALLYKAEVPFLRPKHLADDYASIEDTVAHAIEAFEKHINGRVSIIAIIEPTNPFRTPAKLREAVYLFQTGRYKSVISVCPLERAPQNIFVKGDVLTPFIEKPKVRFKRRQDMKHLCRLSSVVYVLDRDDFLKNKKLILFPLGFVDTTNIEAINIDEELDLDFADFIANKYNL